MGVYTQKVLDKRRDRPIRYRLAQFKTCAEAETLVLQPSSGGLDSIDLEDGGCVKIQVFGEDEEIMIHDTNEGDVDDLYDLSCSHKISKETLGSTSGAKASDDFLCGTRDWDVGSLTTDTGCVAHAADPDGTGCVCNTGYVASTTDPSLCVETCDAGYARPDGDTTVSKSVCVAQTCTASKDDSSKDGSDGVFYCRYGTIGGTTGVGTCTCTCTGGFSGPNCDVCPLGFGWDGDVSCVACENKDATDEITHDARCAPQKCAEGWGVITDDDAFDHKLDDEDLKMRTVQNVSLGSPPLK